MGTITERLKANRLTAHEQDNIRMLEILIALCMANGREAKTLREEKMNQTHKNVQVLLKLFLVVV